MLINGFISNDIVKIVEDVNNFLSGINVIDVDALHYHRFISHVRMGRISCESKEEYRFLVKYDGNIAKKKIRVKYYAGADYNVLIQQIQDFGNRAGIIDVKMIDYDASGAERDNHKTEFLVIYEEK